MDDTAARALGALIDDWLRVGPSGPVLVIGATAAAALAMAAHAGEVRRMASPAPPVATWLGSLARLPRHAAAVVGDLGALEETEVAAVVARLRDLHAARLLLLEPVDVTCRAPRTDRLALGLSRIDGWPGEACGVDCYVFDIDRYKRTPDWLNARHWANPELWGRHRW